MAQSDSIIPSKHNLWFKCLLKSKLDHLCTKLKENEISSLSDLLALNDTAFISLCDKLQLNDSDTAKLKHLRQSRKNKINRIISKKTNQSNAAQLNDVQHLLERYFTEIEDCCTTANQDIDTKFQEIISKLTAKQNALHQHINEWKLNRLQNINKEIENIEQYNQYRNTSDLLQHIQSITPLISVDFNDTITTNEISSLTKFKATYYVSYPKIMLHKPSQFADKNDGYSLKLQRCFKDYTRDVNKDDIILKYKTDEKDDHECKEWRAFKHGSISMRKDDDGIVMEAQALDVLKWNVSYVCRIDYHLRQPMNVYISSNTSICCNIKQEACKEFERIKLEYYGHRGHALTRHPRHLLMNSDTKQYWSAFGSNFTKDETDWIVYKQSEVEKKWIPKQIVFKNYKSRQDVKSMRVYVGNAKSKEWYPLTKDAIKPKLSKELQYFDVDTFDVKLAQDERYTFIKLEFVENHGENNPDMCRFCCRHFSLMGLKTSDWRKQGLKREDGIRDVFVL
eukprot:65977_1